MKDNYNEKITTFALTHLETQHAYHTRERDRHLRAITTTRATILLASLLGIACAILHIPSGHWWDTHMAKIALAYVAMLAIGYAINDYHRKLTNSHEHFLKQLEALIDAL